MPNDPSVFKQLASEISQGHAIRQPIYRRIEDGLGARKKVIAYFTSFVHPVMIADPDADMLEEVLQNSDMRGKELVLILNSPGGEGLAAERIVNICRTYSKGSFSVIVPKKAKSAATMICFGANKIGMSRTSELGPVDPQILIRDDSGSVIESRAAHEIIESYEDLIKKANETKGNLEPYLQQLARFDARDIRRIKSAQQLSEALSIKCLREGMLKKMSEDEIREKIEAFLNPVHTKSHSRPIWYNIARKSGLSVELHNVKSPLWRSIWSLYYRLNYLTRMTHSAKIIESSSEMYTARA